MRIALAWMTAAACLAACPAKADEAVKAAPAAAPEEIAVRTLSPEEQALPPAKFLELARRPFLSAVWCRLKGTADYHGEVRRSAAVRLSMHMGTDMLQAELEMKDGQVARVTQTYRADGGVPDVNLDLSPVAPAQMTLEKFGLLPDDLSFGFLYWNFARELPEESVRGQGCRVLELANPQKKERVQVWMAKSCAFPFRVNWLREGEKEPWRCFEFKEFKRNGDFWFPVAMRLSGLVKPKWEARITFGEAEIAKPSEKPEPSDLFAAPLLPPAKRTASPETAREFKKIGT